jgi:hypothetical protein
VDPWWTLRDVREHELTGRGWKLTGDILRSRLDLLGPVGSASMGRG